MNKLAAKPDQKLSVDMNFSWGDLHLNDDERAPESVAFPDTRLMSSSASVPIEQAPISRLQLILLLLIMIPVLIQG
jgi:hypothetical protein